MNLHMHNRKCDLIEINLISKSTHVKVEKFLGHPHQSSTEMD